STPYSEVCPFIVIHKSVYRYEYRNGSNVGRKHPPLLSPGGLIPAYVGVTARACPEGAEGRE
ncbi:MAG: hypothetical protein ACXV79_18145, partial [Methylobacter sp.]